MNRLYISTYSCFYLDIIGDVRQCVITNVACGRFFSVQSFYLPLCVCVQLQMVHTETALRLNFRARTRNALNKNGGATWLMNVETTPTR